MTRYHDITYVYDITYDCVMVDFYLVDLLILSDMIYVCYDHSIHIDIL